ncbi:unnamed protein product [Trifolium pratense]|uniref:Uncharacterized protein n=2 Tax=Trifolium pratense TaxID=57577 RepID=A0ACB0KYA3_TRIPR|nr:unnamed protein product [Trifolium pratense]
MTEGYSGSDLKNICATAAYRPVRELIQQEWRNSTLLFTVWSWCNSAGLLFSVQCTLLGKIMVILWTNKCVEYIS